MSAVGEGGNVPDQKRWKAQMNSKPQATRPRAQGGSGDGLHPPRTSEKQARRESRCKTEVSSGHTLMSAEYIVIIWKFRQFGWWQLPCSAV